MDQEDSSNDMAERFSRRKVLFVATSSALTAAAPGVFAERRPGRTRQASRPGDAPLGLAMHRSQAAATVLDDGRVLVTGGYERPPTGEAVRPLRSAMLVNPTAGTVTPVAPMNVGRARHATVALADGRVVVIGGFAGRPLASVEVYDPRLDRWEFAAPLAKPRCDHLAVLAGDAVCVLGGMAGSTIAGAEFLDYSTDAARPLP